MESKGMYGSGTSTGQPGMPAGGTSHEEGSGINLGGLQLDDLRDRFEELGQTAKDFVRERPLTAILCAVGAGYIVGRILRA